MEYYPNDKNSPYSKQTSWINKKDNFVYKIECYDKKEGNKLIKTILIPEVKIIDGVIMATKMVVENHQTNGKTLFQIGNVKINIGIKDNIFSVQNLDK